MRMNIIGKKFGKLKVLEECKERDKHNNRMYKCICDCGNTSIVRYTHLVNEKIKSCGCLRHNPYHMTHGKKGTKIYNTWKNMKSRCYNKNQKAYVNYGGRGIRVCDEWLNDFMNFYNWAINNGYDDTLTLDRIDVNGNYEPNNCRWATHEQTE